MRQHNHKNNNKTKTKTKNSRHVQSRLNARLRYDSAAIVSARKHSLRTATSERVSVSELSLESFVKHLVQDAVILCQLIDGVVTLTHRPDCATQSVRGSRTTGTERLWVNLRREGDKTASVGQTQ